ncbi:hypothetical protein ABIA39_004537 [Nocardia sp. GAS34]
MDREDFAHTADAHGAVQPMTTHRGAARTGR